MQRVLGVVYLLLAPALQEPTGLSQNLQIEPWLLLKHQHPSRASLAVLSMAQGGDLHLHPHPGAV